MAKKLKELKDRFTATLTRVAQKLEKNPHDVLRDEYVRVTVDEDFKGRLNKEDLNVLGGYRVAKEMYFGEFATLKPQPKILVYDIETAPILGYVWGLWNNDIGLNQIESDWYILSWSAKWLGSDPKDIMYQDQRDAENIENDKELLEGIWKLLDEADIVITQNGKKFDQKKLNARFIINDMQPPSSYRHIDTRQIARKTFGFTSAKLEYMTDKLCVKYKKLKHAKFAGFSLWTECLKGNEEAWNEMEIYNKHDVLSLEELYGKMAPWDNTINFGAYTDSEIHVCKCGSVEFKKSGFHHTNAGRYQKYKCKACGHETRDLENLLPKATRKSLKRVITPSH